MKTYKILQVSRAVEGGVAVIIEQLLKGLNKNKFEPFVLFDTEKNSLIRKKLKDYEINHGNKNIYAGEKRKKLKQKQYKNKKYATRIEQLLGKDASKVYLSCKALLKFIQSDLPKVKTITRIIRREKIDLVHTHNNLHNGKSEIIAAWLNGVPCICHCHTFTELNHFDKLFSILIDTFIYISNSIANFYLSLGYNLFSGEVIYNGVDINEFTKTIDREDVRKELNIKPGEHIVGIIGRLDWWKGHEYFIESIAIASRKNETIKGIIVGGLETNVAEQRNLEYLKYLKIRINKLNLSNRIVFTGHRNDVTNIINSIDIVVHASSKPEPFGLVIIEGMAAKKPVVATAAGGVLDIIEDKVNGILVSCKDADAMARAILELIENKAEAKRISTAGHKSVVESFSIGRQIKSIETLYEKILSL